MQILIRLKNQENIIGRIVYLQRQLGNEIPVDANGIPVLHESYLYQPLTNLDWTVFEIFGVNKI